MELILALCELILALYELILDFYSVTLERPVSGLLANGTSSARHIEELRFGRIGISAVCLNEELLDPLSVCKQRLLGIRDLTAQLVVSPPFPVAGGGFSDVYRGTLKQLDAEKKVAIKVLRTHQKTDGERTLKSLSREALVFSSVNHPLVAKFYGLAVVGGRPAMVLEWYDQGTACDYLRDKSSRQKLAIVQDIAHSLEYLHSQNIIHGDLKGSNVLITNEGRAVLTDFGLSRILDVRAGITTTSVTGSIPWLSPELVTPWLRIHNPVPCTKASDVWAFGCTAIELLSGDVPYSNLGCKIPQAIADAIRRGVLPFQSSQEVGIPVIIEQCFEFKPSGRPTMAYIIEMLS